MVTKTQIRLKEIFELRRTPNEITSAGRGMCVAETGQTGPK